MAIDNRKFTLPPYPAQANPGDYIWIDWWKKLQDYMIEITKVSGTEDITSSSGYHVTWAPPPATEPPTPPYPDSTVTGKWTVVGNVCSFQLNFLPPSFGSFAGGVLTAGAGGTTPIPSSPVRSNATFTYYRTATGATLTYDLGGGTVLEDTAPLQISLSAFTIPGAGPEPLGTCTLSGFYLIDQ